MKLWRLPRSLTVARNDQKGLRSSLVGEREISNFHVSWCAEGVDLCTTNSRMKPLLPIFNIITETIFLIAQLLQIGNAEYLVIKGYTQLINLILRHAAMAPDKIYGVL